MNIAISLLIRLGLGVAALALTLGAAVPVTAGGVGCGTTFFAADVLPADTCADARADHRFTVLLVAGLGLVALGVGLTLPAPAAPADPPRQRTEPAWKRDDEQP
jgi:hypothetical protein